VRKVGTILSPECKVYAKDIEDITGVDEYINLQYLRLIENLVCHRICEQAMINKKEDNVMEPITVEVPLMGNLTVTPMKGIHKSDTNLSFTFTFDALPTFKKHIQKIYLENSCELISLLSEKYSKELVETYNHIMEEF